MVRVSSFVCLVVFCVLWSEQLTLAQLLDFELQGMAGSGITADNEPGKVIDGGSGDIGSLGITVNLSTRILSIHIVWGSENGHVDLSSDVDFMNIHGPTELPAPDNFMQSSGTFTGLGGFDPSATGGSFAGDVELSTEDLVDLLEGRFYLHLHTFVNNNGEARGYMIPEVLIGDTNQDGLIDFLDIGPFVQILTDGLFLDEADINRDGVVDFLDIDPFVTLLSG